LIELNQLGVGSRLHTGSGQALVLRFIVLAGYVELTKIVLARGATRRFAGGLDGRQQERNKNRHDRDGDQQLDKRKTV
jgi:hypothetical protein